MGRFFFALIVMIAAAAPASAQGTTRGRPVCSPAQAEKATVAQIAAEPEKWVRRCVSVEAIYGNERLYADEAAIYGDTANRIGGFVDGRGSMLGYWRGTFTGRVSDCAVAAHELEVGLLRSPGISLHGRTLGCREAEGPFLLFMSQGELKPAGLVRRVAPKTGDLQPAPAGAPADAMLAKAGEVLAALKARDAAALKALIAGDAYDVEQLLADDSSPLAAAAKADAPGRMFVRLGRDDPPEAFSLMSCHCVRGDCSKLWPVAWADADNLPGRPYACIRFEKHGETYGRPDVSATYDGLPEARRR